MTWSKLRFNVCCHVAITPNLKILLFNPIFKTTPKVSSKLNFVEISSVLEKLWLFNHKRGFQILDVLSLSASLR